MHTHTCILEHALSHDVCLRGIEGAVSQVTASSRVSLAILPVGHPNDPDGTPLFQLDSSTWMFEVRLFDYGDSNALLKSYVMYRNPHDLWLLVRSRLAYERSCWPYGGAPLLEALTQHLVFCADDRVNFAMHFRRPGGDTHVQARSKYTGFSFTICRNGPRLWLDCFSGSPGRIDSVDGTNFDCFETSYYFPFELVELLELPAYFPDITSGRWMRA